MSLLFAGEISFVGIASSFERPSTGRLVLLLDKDDAQTQHRLGQVYADSDTGKSVQYLRRAAELSRYSRFYWSDLAAACQSINDTQCADRAAEHLLKLCPMVPYYHQLAAESYLRKNRLDESLAQFRRLLELDPIYATDSWADLLTVLEPDVIFQEVLANYDKIDPKVEVGYVDFLSAQGDNDAAYRIWNLVAASPRTFPFSSVQSYLERLISTGRIEEAEHVWQDLERLGTVKSPDAGDKNNLVFNGGFEQSPLNAGFDWRAGAYMAVDFAAPRAYQGAQCLRVDFKVGRNDEYEPVYQIVAVQPSHTYSLKAYVRSQDITSTSGPCLRVTDAQRQGFEDAISETTVGTTDWHPVSLSFSTGPETQSVRLSLWRPRGRVFPMDISGSFWLDAVTLECKDCSLEK